MKTFAYQSDKIPFDRIKKLVGKSEQNYMTVGNRRKMSVTLICKVHVIRPSYKSWATNFTGGLPAANVKRERPAVRGIKANHCPSLETSQEMSFRKGSDLRVLARSVHEIKTKKKNGGEWKQDESRAGVKRV